MSFAKNGLASSLSVSCHWLFSKNVGWQEIVPFGKQVSFYNRRVGVVISPTEYSMFCKEASNGKMVNCGWQVVTRGVFLIGGGGGRKLERACVSGE